jgi:hypothetical protein
MPIPCHGSQGPTAAARLQNGRHPADRENRSEPLTYRPFVIGLSTISALAISGVITGVLALAAGIFILIGR